MDTEPRAQASAVIPVAPKKNGIIGMMAPEAKNKNDAMATFHGLPTDSYSSALSSSAGPCDPPGRAEKLGSQSQVRYPKRSKTRCFAAAGSIPRARSEERRVGKEWHARMTRCGR